MDSRQRHQCREGDPAPRIILRGTPRIMRRHALAAVAFALVLCAGTPATPQTYTVLYNFKGYPTDGAGPYGGLLIDSFGNLYGTTLYGGSHDDCSPNGAQCGIVFKLDSSGVESVLYNFSGPDGANPTANLVMDANGDLYGTTEFGGDTQNCTDLEYAGCGVVFKLSGSQETVLHRFTGGGDGAFPIAGVILDSSGALYGVTYEGGGTGNGVVFKLVGKKETVLHSFTGYQDGADPQGGLIMDAKGNLYGTAVYGGNLNDCDGDSCGVVFKMTGEHETVLHTFKGPPDGATPVATLAMDASGNLFGATFAGGKPYNGGTVFELSPNEKEGILHRFVDTYNNKQRDGFLPVGGVVLDAQGNLYGTTYEGGHYGAGVVYEITVDGKEKILHTFCSAQNCADGGTPYDSLIMDSEGNLYGTTGAGGVPGYGVIFEITP